MKRTQFQLYLLSNMGIIPVILHVELQFMFSAYCPIMVYARAKFGENILKCLCYGADTISIQVITKEHNSVKIAHGVTVLVLCTLSDHGLY